MVMKKILPKGLATDNDEIDEALRGWKIVLDGEVVTISADVLTWVDYVKWLIEWVAEQGWEIVILGEEIPLKSKKH